MENNKNIQLFLCIQQISLRVFCALKRDYFFFGSIHYSNTIGSKGEERGFVP